MNTPNTPNRNNSNNHEAEADAPGECHVISDPQGIALFRLLAIRGVLKMEAKGIKFRNGTQARKAAREAIVEHGGKVSARPGLQFLISGLEALIEKLQHERAKTLNNENNADDCVNEETAAYHLNAAVDALESYVLACRKAGDAGAESDKAVGSFCFENDLDTQQAAVVALVGIASGILRQMGMVKVGSMRSNLRDGTLSDAISDSIVGNLEVDAAEDILRISNRLADARSYVYRTASEAEGLVEEDGETWGGKEIGFALRELNVVEQGLMLNKGEADQKALERVWVILSLFAGKDVMAGIWSALTHRHDEHWELAKCTGARVLLDKNDWATQAALDEFNEKGVDRLVEEYGLKGYTREEIEEWGNVLEIIAAESAARMAMLDLFYAIRHRTDLFPAEGAVEEPRDAYGSDPRRDYDEARYWTPYEEGEDRGLRCFSDQYFWGGRVSRVADAEAAARAVIRAEKDGDGISAFGGRIEPDEKMVDEDCEDIVRELLAYYGKRLSDAERAELLVEVAERYVEGFEAGYWEACVKSATRFLESQGYDVSQVEEGDDGLKEYSVCIRYIRTLIVTATDKEDAVRVALDEEDFLEGDWETMDVIVEEEQTPWSNRSTGYPKVKGLTVPYYYAINVTPRQIRCHAIDHVVAEFERGVWREVDAIRWVKEVRGIAGLKREQALAIEHGQEYAATAANGKERARLDRKLDKLLDDVRLLERGCDKVAALLERSGLKVEEEREVYHVSPSSGNVKTGPIPVTTSSSVTCPKACPFRMGGCYAKHGNLGMFWQKMSAGKVSTSGTWHEFTDRLERVLKSCQPGQLWRHNQAGDLPGKGDEIDQAKLLSLCGVNQRTGSRGFTYTHKPVLSGKWAEYNRAAVKLANGLGFTVNLSANNLEQADRLAALNIGPVVVTVPRGWKGDRTPEGRPVKVCPAQTSDTTCARCQICQVSTRTGIVAFIAHGSGAAKVEKLAK